MREIIFDQILDPVINPEILPPVMEPTYGQEIEELDCLPFRRQTAAWWKRAGDNKCQYEFYDEKKGWQECDKPAEHIHHAIPEGWQLDRGSDPEHSVGVPLCQNHHVRNKGTEEHSGDFSFHSDVSGAYDRYHEYKQQAEHMEKITGKKPTRDRYPSPFEEVSKDHREKSAKGERYWNGTPEIDQYYEDKMRTKADMYSVQHPEDPKPDSSPHNKTDETKKKHWWQ